MKKICVVTAARSEYGVMRWLMTDLTKSSVLDMQLIVTGAHLSYKQGHTIDQIREDGFEISDIVGSEMDLADKTKIAESMGRMAEGFAKSFEKLKPDYVLVLGDRYELLPICNTAFVMNIPIIHLSGGDITEGAIDDGIRNAVTMLADYHFPGTKDSANNIIRMRGSDKNIWAVGELGLDAFNREHLFNRYELADSLGLCIDKKWVMMTYHPETRASLEQNLETVKNCVEVLLKLSEHQVIMTYANADFGGMQINKYLEEISKLNKNKLIVIPSLGHKRYLSCMKEVDFIIGNSSSGIIEAPFLNIPVINIGERQKGRYLCSNVIQSGNSRENIKEAIEGIDKKNEINEDDKLYWGDGHASEKVISILEKELI